jgi:hypothetical protein
MTGSFDSWSESWEKSKKYEGPQIPEVQVPKRIQEVLSLWNKPLPSNWIRQDWSYIKVKGYRRGDKDQDRPKPEHLLEIRLFNMTSWPVTGLGEEVTFLPVLNAVSLANQDQKQREVDVLGILTFPNNRIPCSVEMKGASTNSAWFAVVENLQHLKLIQNHPQDFLPYESPFDDLRNLAWSETCGMVLAPLSFFNSRGQKENSFRDAKKLILSIKQELGVTILLARFHHESGKSIEILSPPD